MRATLLLLPILLAPAVPAMAAKETTVVSATRGQAQPADKVICRKRIKTGTLSSYEKSCHTRLEWEKIGDLWRETWQEVQGTHGSTHGN